MQADGFRVYFTPLFKVLFTFPSRYWFAIGLSGVFSLAGWSPRIQTGFHVSRPTQDTAGLRQKVMYGIITLFDISFRIFPFFCRLAILRSYNPDIAETISVWAVARSLATTCAITFVFFSSGYLDVSVPLVSLPCGMIHLQCIGLPHSEIRESSGYLHLAPAYRSLSRPSSPPRAKASTVCPYFIIFPRLRSVSRKKIEAACVFIKYTVFLLCCSCFCFQYVKDRLLSEKLKVISDKLIIHPFLSFLS